MTGQKFESEFCELLKSIGYWALRIPKNQSGAQPFDVIAIHGNSVLAVDCKVCSQKRFPLDRVEENQWLAFKMMSEKTNARIGIMAYFDGDIYYLPYGLLTAYKKEGKSSVTLTNFKKCWTKEVIKNVLGRYIE